MRMLQPLLQCSVLDFIWEVILVLCDELHPTLLQTIMYIVFVEYNFSVYNNFFEI